MRQLQLLLVAGILVWLQVVLPQLLLADQKDEKLVITADEIRAMQVLKISEVLNRIPGIKAGETSVSIRGSGNVKVFLDGRSINDPTSFSGSVKWSMISLDTIKKIEVIKGGGGTAYGDNTGGGVIVITTKSAQRLGGTVGGYWGDNGQKNASLNLSGRKNNVSASLTSGYESYDGFTVNGDKTRRRLGTRIDYRASQNISLFLSGEYNDEKKGLRGYPEKRTPNSRKNYDDWSWLFGQRYGDMTGRTYYSTSRTVSEDPDKDLYASLEVVKAGQSLQAPFALPFFGRVESGAGYEWRRASGNRFTTTDEEQAWFFLSKTLCKDATPWSFFMGIRTNYYSNFSNTLNPEVKAGYSRDSFSFELSASRSSNLPTFRQRFYESSVTRPNPDLQMERAMNYALSFSVMPDSSLSIDASVFHRDITDRITYVRKPDNTGRYENFGQVTYQGAEVSVTWALSDIVEVSPSYSYLHALNEETGYWLPAKPFHTVLMEVVIQPFTGFSFRTTAKFTGKVYTNAGNTSTIPGYTVVDARADYSLDKLTFYCDIDNLLDERYLYVDGFDAPPREFVVGMNYTF
ncbi:TonB-dependent receptor plug domain-containing protein [Prosthecochloris marina]|nr:TonB-dependent receptor [Prosthecochloris marina]